MPLVETDKYYKDRISNLAKVFIYSSYSWKPNEQELDKLFSPRVGQESVQKLFDSADIFVIATSIERKFPGPAILLYVAAVEAFLEGPDTELKSQIHEAKDIFDKLRISGDPNVKAVVAAASERAQFAKVTSFVKKEFEKGICAAGYPQKDSTGLAKRIVRASNDVRHRAQPNPASHRELVAFNDGTLHDLDQQEIVPRNGAIGSFQFTAGKFDVLLEPARRGSANVLSKRIEQGVVVKGEH